MLTLGHKVCNIAPLSRFRPHKQKACVSKGAETPQMTARIPAKEVLGLKRAGVALRIPYNPQTGTGRLMHEATASRLRGKNDTTGVCQLPPD